jgi:copper resistance protein B
LATGRSHYFAGDESLAGAHLDAARGGAALGVRGLAPLGVDVEASVYAGGASRTAARLIIAYELLFTQRFLLQSEFEMNLCGNANPARDVSAGLSDLEVGLRLRYEVRRAIAPYAGVYGQSGAARRERIFC